MTKRFFKLLYALALICIALSLPITILTSVQFDKITITSYKAKCLSNNQYVVLEGSQQNEAYVFDEITLEDTIFSDTKKTLNFYCRYYDEVQPYIVAYTEAKTNAEVIKVNQDFFRFQQSVISNVYAYPAQYQLEVGFAVPVAPVISGALSFEAHKENDPEALAKWEKEGTLTRVGSEGDVKVQHWSQMVERLNHDLLKKGSALTMPLLFVVGSEDTSCPPKHIQKLFDVIPNDNKDFQIIKGAPHSFHKKEEQDACKKVIEDWLNKH